MAKRVKISEQQSRQIAKLYNDGHSGTSIATQMGLGVGSVYRNLQDQGITNRVRRNNTKKIKPEAQTEPRTITLEDLVKIRENSVISLLSAKYPPKRVAELVGVKTAEVYRIMRAHRTAQATAKMLAHIPTTRKPAPVPVLAPEPEKEPVARNVVTLAEIESIVELYKAGQDDNSIAEHIGIYPRTVQKVLRLIGIRNQDAKKAKTERDKCIVDLYNGGTRILKIAEILTIDRWTVRQALIAAGIKDRNKR